MMTGTDLIRLRAVGDSALLVEFENRISSTVHEQVLALTRMIDALQISGVRETVSAYRAVLVHYDALTIDYDTLCEAIHPLLGRENPAAGAGRHWQIPALYAGQAAYDLGRIATQKELSQEEVVTIHSSVVYRVYMVGFAPGWTFLGGLDPRLFTPRLETPRLEVPAGCISIGGQQTLVAGPSMPSGWNLIGQTPERLFAPERETAFFLTAGDRVSFRPVQEDEFEFLSRQVADGKCVSTELSE